MAININRPQKREFGHGFMLTQDQRVAAKQGEARLCVNISPPPMKATSSEFYVEDHRNPPATINRQRTRN